MEKDLINKSYSTFGAALKAIKNFRKKNPNCKYWFTVEPYKLGRFIIK